MKILFAGWHNPRFMSITEYIERALIKLGHELEIFEYRQYSIPGRIRNRFPVFERYDINRINSKFLKTAALYKPDLVFILQGTTIKTETITLIRETLHIPVVNWFIDYPPLFDTAVNTAKFCDYFFVGSTNAMIRHHERGNTGVRVLNFACDPEIHKDLQPTPEEKAKYRHDIVFVGSRYPEREKVLSSLSEYDVGLWGPGWETAAKNNPIINKFYKGDHSDPKIWVKIYNSAKIVLNINYGFESLPEIERNPGSNKLFEILACGGLQFVDYNKAITDIFTDGKQLVTYKDINDLKNKIRYYLDNEELGKKIAFEGRKEVLAKHTYEQRMRDMLSVIFPIINEIKVIKKEF
jgi:spore maturation protein CgeB